MNSLGLLLKVNLLHLFNLNALLHVKNTKNKLKLLGFAFTLFIAAAVICVYAYMYFYAMAPILFQTGTLDLLLGAMMAIASLIITFTSIYKVVGMIINCKDYDLLSALPISNKTIMISKWTMLYATNLIVTLLVMIPALVVYIQFISVPFTFYILYFLFAFLIPLIPLVIGCIIGIVIQYVSSFFRSKNLISIFLTFILVLAIMYFSFSVQTEEQLIDIGTMITNTLNHIYPLTGMFIQALAHNNWAMTALFIAINVVVFTIFIWFVSAQYQTLNSLVKKHNTVSHYQLEKTKSSSVFMTLFKKEVKRYFSSTIYVTNTAMGIVLQTVGVVFLAIKGVDGLEQMLSIPGINEMLSGILPLFICATIGLGSTTAASISIEGDQLWIIKSLPIDAMTIFKAKMGVNMIVTIPLCLVNVGVLGLFFRLPIFQILFTAVLAIICILFFSMFGLIINLNFPVFDWVNEVQIVKQSVSSFISIFAGLATIIIPGYLFIRTGNMMVLYGFLGVMIVLVLASYFYLKTAGTKIFNQL
ncbi:MAG: hypothetical protein ACLROI_04040 [Beduini sp.]|uniref:hypothetical protein n=1 Tax=Beduini sp. TaxID=1922300 RepID=UPI0011C8E260